MTVTAASQIEVGAKVCEADGFMWEVKSVRKTKSFVTFGLSPVFQTMLRERDHDRRVKATSMMRVA